IADQSAQHLGSPAPFCAVRTAIQAACSAEALLPRGIHLPALTVPLAALRSVNALSRGALNDDCTHLAREADVVRCGDLRGADAGGRLGAAGRDVRKPGDQAADQESPRCDRHDRAHEGHHAVTRQRRGYSSYPYASVSREVEGAVGCLWWP